MVRVFSEGVFYQWQNQLGKVREEKCKIKVVLGKSGITPEHPRGWGWVTGSRGRVGPSLAIRERIERVSWCRPHGCDQRGNNWLVRLQRFWRKSSFVALTWKIEKKNNCRAFVTDSSLTSSKLPSQTSFCQAWTALVSDGCVFSDEPVNVERSVETKELDGIIEFIFKAHDFEKTVIQAVGGLLMWSWLYDWVLHADLKTNVVWNALTWSFSDAAIPVYGNSQSC